MYANWQRRGSAHWSCVALVVDPPHRDDEARGSSRLRTAPALRALGVTLLVGVLVDAPGELLQIALGDRTSTAVGWHMAATAACIALSAHRWLRWRFGWALGLLGLLAFGGAFIYGLVFALRRDQLSGS